MYQLYKMENIPENVLNPDLYKKAKKMSDEKYKRNSAYKSMYLVKTYKDLGGKYSTKKKMSKLERWRKEKWKSVLDYLNGKDIACGSNKIGNNACRPTVRVDKETPMTIQQLIKKHGKKKLLEFAKKKKNNMDLRADWNNLKFN